MKIEHWHCQDNYPAEQLVYGNLLGACLDQANLQNTSIAPDTLKANQNLGSGQSSPRS